MFRVLSLKNNPLLRLAMFPEFSRFPNYNNPQPSTSTQSHSIMYENQQGFRDAVLSAGTSLSASSRLAGNEVCRVWDVKGFGVKGRVLEFGGVRV